MPINTPVNTQLSSSYPLEPSRIEDIDYALYNYLEGLHIRVDTNEGFSKVPVIFSVPERSYQIKNNPTLRSENGRTLIYPLMSIVKNSMVQDPAKKGRYGVYIPPYFDYYDKGGALEIARVVNQKETLKFANVNAQNLAAGGTNKNYKTFPNDNKNIVYETITIPMPTFVEIEYGIQVITEYQQQMNEILAVFTGATSTPSVFSIEHNGHRYEAFIDPSYGLDNNSSGLGTNERVFKTTVTIRVLGHITGQDKNQRTPNVVRRQSAAKIQFQRERVILGDIPHYDVERKDKYRP